ncbi:MAG: phosphate ABC transporter, permease protein PstA [Candidatus Reconcilbacillus cellulovorans]|uniref:Phosphate transport system permease protein PstA n=1 Tax=Candidatus Reconcilbacillus cellulovorans TaxID=1906605 RepID=A0A2A6E365_9BACL|nr:MAG: phosphate ABC transporter, permease protein PstA [Candidatus Reconcilbacillus cellulovorans]
MIVENVRDVRRIERKRRLDRLFHVLFFAATTIGLIALALLLVQVIRQGVHWLRPEFFTNFASRIPERAGIKAALAGTLWLMLMTGPLTFVVGVATAVYLEEYARPDSRLARLIRLNIANLAGVPSIVYGMLGLTVFVRFLDLKRGLLTGALTLTLLVLPTMIVAAQEAIRAVPDRLRHASLALGATRWQTVVRVVLPSAMPGILTGSILALSRAIGETAPLIVIGAVTYVAFMPRNLFDSFTALPIQIYSWTALPKAEFQELAAAAIIVLLALLLGMNALAIALRDRYRNRYRR